jgi:hypothetical protein
MKTLKHQVGVWDTSARGQAQLMSVIYPDRGYDTVQLATLTPG